KIHDPRDPIFASSANASLEPASTVPEQSLTAAELAGLRSRMEWRYPHGPATREAAKTSVTRLRRRLWDETDDPARRLFHASGFTFHVQPRQRPAPGRVTAAEIGTAHHTFLEWVSLDRVGSLSELEAEA